MRWTTESPDQRMNRLGQWKRWWAWYPVTIGKNDYLDFGPKQWRWLEYVEVRSDFFQGWRFDQYRDIQD